MLRGLLLDSGDTLMRPRGGRWNPRFDFEDVVIAAHPTLAAADFTPALAAGEAFMREADWHSGDYTNLRASFHRTILAELGVPDPSAELLAALDRPLPFLDLVEPFEDTAAGLGLLRADGWRMAIVADTGPEMVDVYRDLGLDGFFETFVISRVLGVSKPDPLMYRTASDALGLEPHECLFVDDSAENIRGALALGYLACGISRYGTPPDDGLDWVRDLAELRVHAASLAGNSR